MNRPSDGPTDDLLYSLAERIKARNKEWVHREELQQLEDGSVNIDTYFPQSRDLLARYVRRAEKDDSYPGADSEDDSNGVYEY
jgi:hypothetical protein